MIRLFCLLMATAFITSPVLAADDGGFGSKFTSKTPSALMESPDSTVAQIVPDASQLENIIPAAGDETPSDEQTKDKNIKADGIVETKPVTEHGSVESHMTVPATINK